MKTIEYRVQYTGVRSLHGQCWHVGVEHEEIHVQARNINSGYSKALKVALQPLGSGVRREIGSVEFWKIV
jgi:hypothetical protein